MVEFVLIVALFIVAYRLRRAVRAPQPRIPIELHVHHHFDPDPGERMIEARDARNMAPSSTNVVSFRRR